MFLFYLSYERKREFQIRNESHNCWLFRQWGQYPRTDEDDTMERGMEAERTRKADADAQKEDLQRSRQAHIPSRDDALFAVPNQTATLRHDFRPDAHYPQAS